MKLRPRYTLEELSELQQADKDILPVYNAFKRDPINKPEFNEYRHLANEFWSRWKKEYLQGLQSRQKWNNQRANIQVGDVVIIKDDNAPRNQWSLGRVEETLASDDDLVRQAKIRLATKWIDRKGRRMAEPKFLERPITKLVVLVKNNQEEVSEYTEEGTDPVTANG